MEMMRTDSLSPHPINTQIYNDSADDKLIDSIDRLGILQPLVVTRDGVIVSGHRRYSAAVQLGLEFVPVRVVRLTDWLDIQEAMIEANRQRIKTQEQITMEIRLLRGIQNERAVRAKEMNLPGSRESDAPDRTDVRLQDSALGSHAAQSGSLIHFGKNGGLHESGISGQKGRAAIAQTIGKSERVVRATNYCDDTINDLRDNGWHKEADELDYELRKTNTNRAEKRAKELRMKLLNDKFHRSNAAYIPPVRKQTDVSTYLPPIEASIEEQVEEPPIEKSETLLPCSHCGCTDVLLDDRGGFYQYTCAECGPCGSETEAREQWNRRI